MGREVVRRLAGADALALAAAIWFLGKFLRYAFPPLFATLSETYGVSRTALGTAFTGFMLVYAAMQFPSGWLADRVGSVRVIAAGTVVTAAGALALVVDSPFLVLAAAMAVMGAGTGTIKTVSVELLSRVYPARTGRALGVFDTCGSLAGAAAPAAVVAVAGLPAVFGAPWRTIYLAGGLACLLAAAGFVVRVPRRLPDRDRSTGQGSVGAPESATTPESATIPETVTVPESATGPPTGAPADSQTDVESAVSLRTYLGLFRRGRFAAFVGVTVLFSFAYNGAIAFLPLYLTSETTVSAVTANLLFGALFLVSLVQVVTGEASDRLGTLPILLATVGLATAGLVAVLALSAAGGPLVLGAAVVAFGLGAHGYRPVRSAYLMTVVPSRVASGGLGVVRTLLMVAGAVSPAVVGYFSETAGFGAAFGLLAAALAAATLLTGGLWLFE